MSVVAAVPLDFTKIKKGMRARVKQLVEDEQLFRLQELGLTEGTEFKVLKIAPFGDPVEIQMRGYRLCLRKRELAGIQIEILE